MSEDKLDLILARLESIETSLKAHDGRFEAIDVKLVSIETTQQAHGGKLGELAKRQVDDFGMLTGALEGVTIKLADIEVELGGAIRRVEGKTSELNRQVAQLRAEHGGYLRAIQNEVKGIDQRVTELEAKP